MSAAKVFTFATTEEAYDSTQCRADIRHGDIVLVPSANVAGVLYRAWPTAVTAEHGELHGGWDESEMTAENCQWFRGKAREVRAAYVDWVMGNVHGSRAKVNTIASAFRWDRIALSDFAAFIREGRRLEVIYDGNEIADASDGTGSTSGQVEVVLGWLAESPASENVPVEVSDIAPLGDVEPYRVLVAEHEHGWGPMGDGSRLHFLMTQFPGLPVADGRAIVAAIRAGDDVANGES